MSNRRIDVDVRKLMQSDFETRLVNDDLCHLIVKFEGPVGTPYEGGVWEVNVELPKDYPFMSPSVGFRNRIFHPNVEPMRGSVCLDVLNRTWTPIFGLVNVFELFLPQLLAYPNASDPLNAEAGRIWKESEQAKNDKYNQIVRQWVDKYARPKREDPEPESDEMEAEESDSSLSSLSELSDDE